MSIPLAVAVSATVVDVAATGWRPPRARRHVRAVPEASLRTLRVGGVPDAVDRGAQAEAGTSSQSTSVFRCHGQMGTQMRRAG